MATVNDVARVANVSKSTVSYVLSGKKYVSDSIRDRVIEACRALDYTPNFFAANVLSNRSGIIGLFFEPNNNNWYQYYSELLASCIIEAEKLGYRIIPYFNMSYDDVRELLRSGRAPIMGAIILTPKVLDERIEEFGKDKLPFVLIGKPSEAHSDIVSVDINNIALTLKIFEYIYKRGHRRILFLNADSNLAISRHREKALADFLSRIKDVEVTVNNIDKDVVGAAREAFIKALDSDTRYTCVVTASDILAHDIYDVAKERSLTIGKDISVIAFGGKRFADFSPALTIAQQNYEKIGKEAIKIMHRILEKNLPSDVKSVLVNSLLHEGDSVAVIK